MTIRIIMASGDTELTHRIKYTKEKDGPISISVDTGNATITKVINDVAVSTASEIVTPGDPKTIYGAGEWDVVRSADTVNVEAAVLEK